MWSLYLNAPLDALMTVATLNQIPGVSDAAADAYSRTRIRFAVQRHALPSPT